MSPTQFASPWWLAFLLVVAALAVTPFFLAPKAALNTAQRWAMPWADIERYTFTTVEQLPNELFVPHGVPGYLLPLVVAIEILSFLSRPISLSVRRFANMLAGHITLKVFASFILMLGAWGVAGWFGAVIPFAMTVALTALEILVAFLQAYVFAILTCMYLNDALHPSH